MRVIMNRVIIKQGWWDEGRVGKRLGSDILIRGIMWTPVLWDDEEDPNWHKSRGIESYSKKIHSKRKRIIGYPTIKNILIQN